jgi:hypothetical protein
MPRSAPSQEEKCPEDNPVENASGWAKWPEWGALEVGDLLRMAQ